MPGGKQEYNETFFEGAKREVKEETNLDIDINDLLNSSIKGETNNNALVKAILSLFGKEFVNTFSLIGCN